MLPYLLTGAAGFLIGWLARSFTTRRRLLKLIGRLNLYRQYSDILQEDRPHAAP